MKPKIKEWMIVIAVLIGLVVLGMILYPEHIEWFILFAAIEIIFDLIFRRCSICGKIFRANPLSDDECCAKCKTKAD